MDEWKISILLGLLVSGSVILRCVEFLLLKNGIPPYLKDTCLKGIFHVNEDRLA